MINFAHENLQPAEGETKQPNKWRRRAKYAVLGGLTGAGVWTAGLVQLGLAEPTRPGVSQDLLDEANADEATAQRELQSVFDSTSDACVAAVAESFADLPPAKHPSYIYDEFSNGSISEYEMQVMEFEYTTAYDAAEAEVIASGVCESGQNTASFNIVQAHEALFDVRLAQDAATDAHDALDRHEGWETDMDSMLSPWLIGGLVGSFALGGAVVYGKFPD